MAKKPGKFVGAIGNTKYYYTADNKFIDQDGKIVSDRIAAGIAATLGITQETKQPKETLQKAFPEAYQEPVEKKRTAVEQKEKEQVQKEAQEYKRDNQELKSNIGSISSLMRENNALIRQQLTTQQRSITLLSEISKNIKDTGGVSGPSILSNLIGWKGLLALAVGAATLGGIGGYALSKLLEGGDTQEPPPAAEENTMEEPPPAQSAAIQEAQQRGDDQQTEILTIEARELIFNSDKLSFNVDELTIDADNIKTEGRESPTGQTGGNIGGATPATRPGGATPSSMSTPQGEFKPSITTPSIAGTPGGQGAYAGFKSGLSVKDDITKTMSFQPTGGATPSGPQGGQGATGGSRSWRNNNPGNIEYGEFAKSMGATGTDGRFAIFPDYNAGRNAQEKLLFEGKNYKNLTIGQAIARWAPGSENNVPAYVAAMGGNSTKRMSEYSAEERSRLLDLMQKHEGWKVGKGKENYKIAQATTQPIPNGIDMSPTSALNSSSLTGGMIEKAPLSPQLQEQERLVSNRRKEMFAIDENQETNQAAERAIIEKQANMAQNIQAGQSPAKAGARSIRSAVNNLLPMPEQAAPSSQNLTPPPEPEQSYNLPSMARSNNPNQQASSFSGNMQPENDIADPNATVAWHAGVTSGIHPAFSYLFPKESKFGLQLGNN